MFGLFLGAICISFAPIFVKLIDLSPTLIGFYRCFFGAVLLFPFIYSKIVHSRNDRSIYHQANRKLVRFLTVASVFFALDLFVWHRSVVYAGAGIGTILANTQVFYLALFGVFFLKEPFNGRLVFSILLGFVGLVLLVRFQDQQWVGPNFQAGVVYGFLTGLAYAVFVLLLRKAEKMNHRVSTEQKLFHISAVAAVVMLGMVFAEGGIEWPRGPSLGWLLLLAGLPQGIGWILITKNLPKVSVGTAGLVLLTQPVLATIMGVKIFGEQIAWFQALGAALTLLAVALGSARNSKRI